MPPTRTAISSTVEAYLSRHPDERDALAAVLAALDQPADVTARSTLPGHVTCSAVVIDRQGRVLHVRHRATGLLLVPGGHVEPGDRTLLAAALREASEEAGIAPGSLCLTPQMLGSPIDIDVHDIDADPAKGEPAHRHYDFRYVFCLAGEERPAIVLQDEEVSGARWLTVPDVTSPTLRAKLLRTKPDGQPEPVNASVLIHDGSGRYLLRLRDHKPGVIWQSGAFDLLGGGRAHHDRSLEDTLVRELSEEVPDLRLEDLEPYAVEQATGIDGLSVPIQVFTGRWQGNPDRLRLHEGVLLHWFTPDELDRLRMSPATRALVRRHATGPTTEARPTAAPPSRDGSSRTPFLRDRSRVVHGLGERLRDGGELVVITPVAETTPEERRGIALDEDEIRVLCEGWETTERLDADGLAFLVLRGPRHPATPAVERLPATGHTLAGAIPGLPPVASCPIAADQPPAPGQPDEAVRPGEATARTVIDDGRAPSAPAAGNGRYSDHHREEPVSDRRLRTPEEKLAAAKKLLSLPRIVVICGSTRFMNEMTEADLRETTAGRIVVKPGCDMKSPHELWSDPVEAEALKGRLDELHRAKIRLADEVLVVGDYIGDSTRAEIAYARSLGKPVRFTHPAVDPDT